MDAYVAGAAAGLPRGRDPRRRQDDLRADPRLVAAAPPRRAADHRRRADRAPEEAVGGRGGADRHQAGPGVQRGPAEHGVPRRRGHLRGRRRAADAAPQPRASSARRWSSSTRSTTPATASPGARRAWRRSSPATRRLALTGTPFRSDTNPIPFVDVRGGQRRHPPLAPPTTPTATATRSPTASCGPVIFLSYSGNMRWRTKAGDEIAARLGEPMTKDAISPGVAHRARPARRLDARTCCAPPTSG